MSNRTVSVTLQARVSSYLASLSAASKATSEFANKVDVAKGKAATGYASIGHGMMLAGGLVGAGVAIAVHEMAGFQSRLAQVQSLSRASSSDMQKLHDAAMTTGTAFGFSADEAADAEIELTKAGVSVSDMLGGALKGALTLAAAGQMNVADATEIAAVAMTQFKLKGQDVPHIADLLAAGADKALGSVQDLGYGLKAGGLVASQFDLSLETTVGTLSAFANAGLIGEQGGTVLKQMLIQLASPSKQASGIMQDLGIHVYNASGKFVGLANLAGQLQGKMRGLTQAERDHDLAVIFGFRAIQGANVLYQQGAAGIKFWAENVNDAGFAALQAAGKMDSLSGDVKKFESALQNAFIGAGENADGPLRVLVQDATDVVNAWNKLPGPIKEVTELLIVGGGAALFIGGAFITIVPKIAATKAAMGELGITTKQVSGVIGKGGLLIGGALAAVAAVSMLDNQFHHTRIDADALKVSLTDLGKTGIAMGEITRAFGDNLSDLKDVVDLSGDGFSVFGIRLHNVGDMLTHTGGDFSDARNKIEAVDNALAGMVRDGNALDAERAYNRLSEAAKAQGVSMDQLASRFPEFNGALRASESAADGAAGATDIFGNKVDAAGHAMASAADKAKTYADNLKALTDPLFAFNQSLQGLKDKQKAAADAQAKYGKDSKQYKQALIDLASSAVDAMGAAHRLAGEVKDGNVSVDQAVGYLNAWVKAGVLTKAQAEQIAASFGGLIDKASRLAHSDAHVDVYSNTHGTESKLTALQRQINALHGKTININTNHYVNGGAGGHLLEPQSDRAYGGWVGGNGGPRQDNIPLNASTGEFVVQAGPARANASLLEAINSGRRIDVTRFSLSGGGAAASRPSVTFGDITINYPEPERASEDLPRVLRDMQIRSGMGWS